MGKKVEEEKKSVEGGDKKAEEVAEKQAKADGGGEKKPAAEGGEKKEDTANVVVLKLDLHCEGCAKKVRRAVTNFEGVEKVKTETSANKLIVTGNIDPVLLQEKVQSKTKKKVDLISPTPPKKESGAGDKKSDQISEKKVPEKKSEKPKQPVSATVVMKMRLHCEGCAHKIKRTILKNSEGVESVKTDLQNNSVTVTGIMNVAELAGFLQEKLKRGVEIVPPAKKNGGDKEEAGGGGIDKKEKGKEKKEEKKAAETGAIAGDDGGSKAEVNKMDYASFNPYTYYAMPMYNSHSYSTGSYAPSSSNHGYYIGDEYHNRGYPLHERTLPPPPPVAYVNGLDDRMFSDENPNACFIM